MLDDMLPDTLQDPEQTAALAASAVEHTAVVAVHIGVERSVVAAEHSVGVMDLGGRMVVHNVRERASELVRHNANT
jgi:hypothetical protein